MYLYRWHGHYCLLHGTELDGPSTPGGGSRLHPGLWHAELERGGSVVSTCLCVKYMYRMQVHVKSCWKFFYIMYIYDSEEMMVCNIITIYVHGGNNDWYFIKIHLHASEIWHYQIIMQTRYIWLCILFRTFSRMCWLSPNQLHR